MAYVTKKQKLPIAVKFELENGEDINFQFEAFEEFRICENSSVHWYSKYENNIKLAFGGAYFRIKNKYNYTLENIYHTPDDTTTAFDRLIQHNDIIQIVLYYPDKKIDFSPWIDDEEEDSSNQDQSSIIDKESGDLLILIKSSVIPSSLEG